ncbi:flagellar motor switch protein FliN [Oryzihumus sp.]
MTAIASPVDTTALQTAAQSIAARIPAAGQLEARVLNALERGTFTQGAGAVALAVRVSGPMTADIALIVGPEAAAALAEGPAGATGTLATWESALEDVVSAFGVQVGALQKEAFREVDAATVVRVGVGELQQVAGLFDGTSLVAAVVVTADAGATQAQAAPVQAATFQPLAGSSAPVVDPRRLQLLRDVVMGVSVELGRTRMTVRELLSLTPGAIVELDRAAGSPVDLLVNGTLMARGEVVVVDEEFAVRVTEIVAPDLDGRLGA